MNYFSDRESKIIKILGRKKMTLEQISIELFKGSKEKPLDTNIIIANSVRRIIKKCLYHNFRWTIVKRREQGKLVIRRENLLIG